MSVPVSLRPNTKSSLNGSVDHSLVGEEGQEAPPLQSYLFLTILTCFCPAYPVNIVALVFSVLSRNSYFQGDYEGSRRLGQKALHVGIASIVLGLLIIIIFCIVHFTTVSVVLARITSPCNRCTLSHGFMAS
ncbi:transmembrane protein 233-like [Arapaima gigas]